MATVAGVFSRIEKTIEERISEKIFVLLVVALAFLLLISGTNKEVNLYDEGLIVTGASLVDAGAIPHRDFYANYGPGQFWVLALVFKLFGPSILIERMWDLAVKVGIVWISTALSLRMMPRTPTLAVSALCAIWLTFLWHPAYPLWPALFLSLVGVRILFSIFEGTASRGLIFLAGLSIGAIVLFRYDVAFFACAADSLVVLVFAICGPTNRKSLVARSIVLIVPFWLGVASVLIPLMLFYAATNTIPDFIFQIIEFPAKFYAQMRSLPFPRLGLIRGTSGLSNFIVYLPIIAILYSVALGLSVLFNYIKDGQKYDFPGWAWKLALVASISVLFYSKGFVRVSPIQMSLSIIPAFIVLAAVTYRIVLRPSLSVIPAIGFALLAPVIPSLPATVHVAKQVSYNVASSLRVTNNQLTINLETMTNISCQPEQYLERARCFSLPTAMIKALEFVHDHSVQGEKIFVGVGRHDKIFINNIAFYFLADRPPATKWYHFDPGLQTSNLIQSKIVADLEADMPRFVVLDTEWDEINEPNGSSVSSGVNTLDNYIDSNFLDVADFGPFRILGRNG